MPLETETLRSPAAPLIHLSTDYLRATEYLEAIVASTSDAICTTDVKGRFIFLSPGAESMLGAKASEVLGHQAHRYYEGGKPDAQRMMRLLKRQGSLKNHEMVLKSRDGRRIHISMSASLLRDKAGKVIGTIGISKDITSRVELENRLRELSITDSLTGLFNQRHFQERLKQEASRARRQRYPLSLILMDLDGFKAVNDTRGHLEGDRLLRAFAGILMACVRSETDSAFRYGGDEFTVLLPGSALARAEKVARRIADASKRRLERDGVRFSYGTACLSASGAPAKLVREADARMFLMKSARGGSKRPLA